MQSLAWSKGKKILLGVLGGAALSGLLVLLGFAVTRAVTTATVAEETSAPTAVSVTTPAAAPTVSTRTVQMNFVPASPTPAPVLTFETDAEHPMPEDALLALGEAYGIGGTITSNRKLIAVTVSISCAHNNQPPYPYRVTARLTETGKNTYRLTDPADGGESLAELVDFSKLLVGAHTMRITASCEDADAVELYRCRFAVAGEDWLQITKENFPDSYPEALAFFGSTERFLYRYQWVNGRYILADPAWEKEYIMTLAAYPDGEPWMLHKDGAPFFEKAFEYLETTYIRVRTDRYDTGVIPLKNLITEYNGCYVSRFTSSLKSISHHTFGTAVDVNASMEPNKNNAENQAVIHDDVTQHLIYNGIVTEDGFSYYDYSYDGTYELDPNGVPQTCVNYLLYELAFYRAGFEWAHYYKATSDAMHFCLSEFVTYTHDDKEHGLRKVFVYCAPMHPDEETLEALPTPSLPPVEPSHKPKR